MVSVTVVIVVVERVDVELDVMDVIVMLVVVLVSLDVVADVDVSVDVVDESVVNDDEVVDTVVDVRRTPPPHTQHASSTVSPSATGSASSSVWHSNVPLGGGLCLRYTLVRCISLCDMYSWPSPSLS